MDSSVTKYGVVMSTDCRAIAIGSRYSRFRSLLPPDGELRDASMRRPVGPPRRRVDRAPASHVAGRSTKFS